MCDLQTSRRIQGLPAIVSLCEISVSCRCILFLFIINVLLFNLLFEIIFDLEKSCKNSTECPPTLHPAFLNVNIFCNHSNGRNQNITIGAALLAQRQTLFRFPHFFPRMYRCICPSTQLRISHCS